jgi:drug/metabolite transporter (DMT)-like permease
MKKLIPFLFVFLWSTGFIGTKYGLMYAGTGDFLAVRALASIIVLLDLFCYSIKRN